MHDVAKNIFETGKMKRKGRLTSSLIGVFIPVCIVLGIIGLHDLTFFSVQGTGFGPDAVAAARARSDQALQEYFSSFQPQAASAKAVAVSETQPALVHA